MNKNLLEKCPKFYYINLERSKDRKEKIEKQFNDYNIVSFERIEAIDGKFLENWDNRLSKYEYACTLSHLKAIQTFYESGDELGIICEDDMTFEFLPFWQTPIFDVIKEAPKDWEIIMLGYIIFPNNFNKITSLYNKFIPLVFNSTVCYLINRSGANKILKKHNITNPNLDNYTKIRPVADVIIFDLVNTYLYKYSLFTYPYTKDNHTTLDEFNESNLNIKNHPFDLSKNFAKYLFCKDFRK
jgi:GR25 family glycosyltransferase involved in LPS biosynthesis